MNQQAAGIVELAGGLDPVPRRPERSVRIQSELRRRWKEVIKRQPPATRERFLDSSEGRAALGAATAKQLLKALRSRFVSVADGFASPAAVLDWMLRDDLPAGLTFDDHGRLVATPECRLVRSRAAVRNGAEHPPGTDPAALPIAGPPSRRWTSPVAVELEDEIDLLEPMAAALAAQNWPISPSARAIQAIELRRGREWDGRQGWKRGNVNF